MVRYASGWIADRWRRPKEVAACGYGLSASASWVSGGGQLERDSALILADRIGKGIRTAPRDAMIAASSPGEQLGTAFGVHRAMDTAGAMLVLCCIAILTVAPTQLTCHFVVSLCVALIGWPSLRSWSRIRTSARMSPAFAVWNRQRPTNPL